MLPPALSDLMEISPEIAGALSAGAPVVALESTIVAHGLPYPRNLETALALEADVREAGAVPATIAVLDRRIRVGLSPEQVARLAQARDVMKLSRADIAFALAQGRAGATTVAATLFAARRAGIEVFATGGIGGVHRGAEKSFDISADLPELARTGVITVCAGAKAILDIAGTLEVLETLGVAVVGYRTDDFPAFWSCGSGLPCPLRLDHPAEIARLWRVRRALGQEGSVLVANPPPQDAQIPREEMEQYIAVALAEAGRTSLAPKSVTPFLLARLVELTHGRSLETNIALVRSNARLAAAIAVSLASSGA